MNGSLTKALVASAIGGMLAGLSGCGAGPAPQPAAAVVSGAKDCCKGKNECKNQGFCKTDKGDCRGRNECKGQGGCQNPACAFEGDVPPPPP